MKFIFEFNNGNTTNQLAIDTENPKVKATFYEDAPRSVMSSHTLIDLTPVSVNKSDLTAERLVAMGLLYQHYLDIMADSQLPLSYSAFMLSVLNPESTYMALHAIGRDNGAFDGGKVVSIADEEGGKIAKQEFNDEFDLGGSTDGGAVVFKNGYIVGSYSYNGRLWDSVHFGGRQPNAIEKFISPKQDLVSFYASGILA